MIKGSLVIWFPFSQKCLTFMKLISRSLLYASSIIIYFPLVYSLAENETKQNIRISYWWRHTTENYSVVPAARRQLRGKISRLLQKHQWRLTTHPGEMCSKGDRLSNTASSAAALATPAPLDVMRETKPSLETHLFLHYTASFYSPCLPSGHPRQVEKIKQFR